MKQSDADRVMPVLSVEEFNEVFTREELFSLGKQLGLIDENAKMPSEVETTLTLSKLDGRLPGNTSSFSYQTESQLMEKTNIDVDLPHDFDQDSFVFPAYTSANLRMMATSTTGTDLHAQITASADINPLKAA